MASFRKQPPKDFHALRTLVAFKPDKFAAMVARHPVFLQGMFKELLDAYNKLATQHHENFDCLQTLTSSGSKPDDFAAAVALQPELTQGKFKELFVDYDELAAKKKTPSDEHSFEEEVENEHLQNDFQEHSKHNQEALQVAEEDERRQDDYQDYGESNQEVLQMVEEDDGTFTASRVTAVSSISNPKIRKNSLPSRRDVTMTLAELLSIRPDASQEVRDRLTSTKLKGRVRISQAERVALMDIRVRKAKK